MTNHIRALRVKRGLTQEQLAVFAGITRDTLSKLERGAVDTSSLAVLRAIADALGATPAELVPSLTQRGSS